MSFSGDVKNELCRLKIGNACCAAAELYGIFLFANMFSTSGIRLVTENQRLVARATALLDRLFGGSVPISLEDTAKQDSNREGDSSKKQILHIGGEHAGIVTSFFGYEAKMGNALHLNAALTEEDHCRDAFIRGAFLSGGTITNPEKNYHLELVTRHYSLSREVMALLLDMGFSPKAAIRKSIYMIYFKDSIEIETFLTKCGAPVSAMAVMEAKIEKDLRNKINRKVNCETANIVKTVDAAQRQLESIAALRRHGLLDELDEGLLMAAKLRERNPEASLAELVREADGQISRSGLNHRLGKLVSLASEL